MPSENAIFQETYRYYLLQIGELDLVSIAQKLGLRQDAETLMVPLFGRSYQISRQEGTIDACGQRPPLDISVLLFRHLLMCPDKPPPEKEWVSFKDFKDAGPLTTYFANDVERAITARFTGKLELLEKAARTIGGYRSRLEVRYDLSMQFDALPRIPLVLLVNDEDDEFAASASVLFERRAEAYLDAECLAMLGKNLYLSLKNAAARPNGKP